MTSQIDTYPSRSKKKSQYEQDEQSQQASRELTQSPNRRRKARVLGVAATAATLATSTFLIAKNNHSPTMPGPNEAHKEYTVKPGDTAWTISEQAFPGADPREYTNLIMNQADEVLSP